MGCVPLHNLMEDAATAEIGRTQVWQWIHHKSTLDDKDVLTISRFNQVHSPLPAACCLCAVFGYVHASQCHHAGHSLHLTAERFDCAD